MAKRKMKRVFRKKAGKRRIHRKIIDNSMRTFRCILTAFEPVTNSNAGSEVTLRNNYSLNFPFYGYDNSGTWTFITANLPDSYLKLFNTFAEYKVNSLKYTFIPNRVDTAPTTTDIPGIIYVVYDHSDPSLATEAGLLDSGQRPLQFSSDIIHSRTIKQLKGNRNKYIRSLIGNNGLDPELQPADTLNDINISEPYAVLKTLFPQVTRDTCIGRVYLTYDITFRQLSILDQGIGDSGQHITGPTG